MIHQASSEKVQYASNKPSNKKNRAKINIGIRLNVNLREQMTQSFHLAIKYRNENSSMTLKNNVLINNT